MEIIIDKSKILFSTIDLKVLRKLKFNTAANVCYHEHWGYSFEEGAGFIFCYDCGFISLNIPSLKEFAKDYL